MPTYHLFRCDTDDAESYWITARDEREARQLIAASVAGSADVMDAMRFDCVISTSRKPPEGSIYRRHGGPVKLVRS